MVLDASITFAWLVGEERTEAVRIVFESLRRSNAYVPSLWWLEIANALQTGVRRKRFTLQQRDEFFVALRDLPVVTDDLTVEQAWRNTLRLAEVYGLTVYDASYLEIALRRKLPIATLDVELRIAAAKTGVASLGL